MLLFPRAYVLPGGHLDPKETMRDCCIRELHEECGIEITTTKCGQFCLYQGEKVEVEPYFGFESSTESKQKKTSYLPHSAHFILYFKVKLNVSCEEIELKL